MQESSELLKQFNLRNTHSRAEILEVLSAKHIALSQAELEEEISQPYDRVTVYRTLKTFLDKGIIHKVLDDGGTPKYAICGDECGEGKTHKHEHVHFKCSECGQTNCLEGVLVPKVTLPEGYSYQESNLLVHGVCKNCIEKGARKQD